MAAKSAPTDALMPALWGLFHEKRLLMQAFFIVRPTSKSHPTG
jgi:glutathionylspermidine synthase